ncbi:Rid family hydrolase, partial [Pseudomonas putida]|uniref:Rid family hydrolase n=1 Tax=Pseudomonas putida TaxID=303 RepID=UPI00352584BA
MSRIAIHSDQAPKAIGPYSQAVHMGELVFLTGQIALHPEKMELAQGIEAQTIQVFENLQSVAQAADSTTLGHSAHDHLDTRSMLTWTPD